MTERRFFVYEHRRADTGAVFYIGKGTWTPLKRYVRASTTSKRNAHWRRIVTKAGGFSHQVVAEYEQECDALAEEVRRIALHGRSNLGGLLSNITAGGEGQSGVVMAPGTRQKISAANRGKAKPEHVRAAVSAAQRGVPNPAEQNIAHAIRMTGAGNPNFGRRNSAETIAKRVATRGDKCSGANHPFFGLKRPESVVQKMREANRRPVVDRMTGAVYPSLGDAAKAIGKAESTVSRWLSGHRPNPTALEFA